MLRLLVEDGKDKGQILVLEKSSVSLGTSSDNDVRLSDPFISRHHATIALSGNEWVYQDLASTNGSVIEHSGQQLVLDVENPEAALDTGCLIRIGRTVLRFETDDNARTALPQHTVVAQRDLVDLSQAQRARPKELNELLGAQELERRLSVVSNPEELLDTILEAMLDAFPAATHAMILLIDKKTDDPKRKVARVRGEEGRAKEDILVSKSIADRVLGEGKSLLFNDVATEFQRSESVVSAGINSSLCAPLWTGDETVGLVQVENRGGRGVFSESDLDRLSVFAGRAALGIVASELRDAEKKNRLLQDLSARLIPSFIQKPGTSEAREVRAIDASILFSDIRGYTGTAEKLSAVDAMTMLNAYHSSVEDIIAKHGGTIVKTPGDAVLAVFWRELEGSNHETCALRAGEEILDDLPRMATAWEDKGVKLEIGIGVNAGQVAIGLVGKRHLEPTVIGDPVNVAQRLETITKTLNCPLVFSESIRKRLGEDVEVIYVDEVTVSGREMPLRVYSLARFGHTLRLQRECYRSEA